MKCHSNLPHDWMHQIKRDNVPDMHMPFESRLQVAIFTRSKVGIFSTGTCSKLNEIQEYNSMQNNR